MSNIDIIEITGSIGLGGWFLFKLFGILLHKWGKKNSFAILETDSEIIIRSNKTLACLNSISLFFLLSIFTFIVAGSKQDIMIYLLIIYLICLTLAIAEFLSKKKFKITIHKLSYTIILKNEHYPLTELDISDRSFWVTDDFDSYGLYIKNHRDKPVLVYGYSVLKDIKRLKEEIEVRLKDNH